ncbi:hypothetical protein NDU88_005443 [Pleurodeles waltl]|uniref:Uncharacterized protein n=1 Tax=Pleurodeles waltl TaxID=8319 RepID=A0AAV7QEX4_PLEWA|nr:hypothetical protein NDU88_005443 [Pleurodeles waltl]
MRVMERDDCFSVAMSRVLCSEEAFPIEEPISGHCHAAMRKRLTFNKIQHKRPMPEYSKRHSDRQRL